MGKAKRKAKDLPIEPTPEQSRHSAFELSDIVDKAKGGVTVTLGKAYRRVPMIDTLHEQGLFNDAEYKALKHYRHHADLADKSPLKDSLANLVRISGGSGNGPTVTMLNAVRVRDDCERAAGSLADILRAVAVDDVSLSQWAMNRYGATERCRERKRGRVCTMEPGTEGLRVSQLEMKIVARRVQAELDA